MAAELVFVEKLDKGWSSNLSSVAILGTKSALTVIPSELVPLPSRVFSGLLEKIKPGTDLDGETASSWIDQESGPVQRVYVSAITDFCSRHNSPARPDQFWTAAKKVIPKDADSAVLIALDRADYAYSAACAVARALPLYSRKNYKRNADKPRAKVTIGFHVASGAVDIDLGRIRAATDALRRCAELVDMPTSELTTTDFVAAARKMADSLTNVSVKVFTGEELLAEGLNAIYGVGKAAVEPPAMIVLSYNPPSATKTVAWVGKGIVYDTGGLSLKGSDHMGGMKRDMGGAAAMLTAFVAAAGSGELQHRLHAVLCMAENAIGPKAQRNDDIVYMHSGKTVELNNTDAEGRLVLGDGVSYAVKNFGPDYLFDMATLTGAQGVATGKHHAAIVCNNDELEVKVVAAGKSSGDLVFPLLYCPEFLRSELRSEVADMKNSAKNRGNALASVAAQFIANQLGDYSKPWCHIDMASPVHADEHGTGYGVALLLEILRTI